MEGARWAFRFGAWSPSRSEWLLAARCIQPEERERIRQFMFNKDAKAAIVRELIS
ncbi:L-aminoadipate-semialdehyde dehydrogenase-phosphopantetheinyl transferase [Bagarius yarrelli]|uniref:L-aminoadipate-semialdehyde dehydrogenase-phosphopantetheinyl transferase n=1 Tax=Bagarius yarrelli TaxID=175774 RepID=A0A556V7A3_BAGYA|nr:L-aminoadipate-semialdehyde dehydrogenase-phosphopantetheinyl transferase [Bagarius yarrelli]